MCSPGRNPSKAACSSLQRTRLRARSPIYASLTAAERLSYDRKQSLHLRVSPKDRQSKQFAQVP